jgi:hypothetical protein
VPLEVLGNGTPDHLRAGNPFAAAQRVQRLDVGVRQIHDGPHGVIITRYQMTT